MACATCSQFSRDPKALAQYFRAMVPDTGPLDAKIATDGVSAVFDRTAGRPSSRGDATLVHLPAIGIRGNTHFPFSDLNNLQIADLMARFLAGKRLD